MKKNNKQNKIKKSNINNNKNQQMKKNSFVQGAFVATLGIVICKILGMVYVIPFNAIIGEQGGALYGYAYSIYSIFLGISTAGIPLAMSKMISEYNTLGYYNAKERAFNIGKRTLNIMGIISFTLLIIFSEPLAHFIIGDTVGGNSVADVTYVIRLISLAILVVPIMSIYRGYLQGHKYITPTSYSQIIEQLVRVTIIILGSFLGLKVFNLSLRDTVGIAVSAATIGAISSFLYLYFKTKHNRKELTTKPEKVKEPKITNKEIVYKLLGYAFPFIMIDVFKSLYNSVDVFMLVKVLVNGIGYTKAQAEAIMSVISTWGLKINMIIISISTGIMISLIPNLTSSIVKKDYADVRRKINLSLQVLLYLTLPMAVGLSILAKPVWTIFYGVSEFGPQVYALYVFVAVATVLFTTSVTTVQLLKDYKVVFISLLAGFLTNVVLNIPLLYAFNHLGLPAYYGSTTSTILGYSVCSVICLAFLNRKYKVSYESTIRKLIDIIISTLVMAIILLILKNFIPFTSTSRITNVFIVMLYAVIGAIIYFTLTIKNGVLYGIFGQDIIKNVTRKLKKGK